MQCKVLLRTEKLTLYSTRQRPLVIIIGTMEKRGRNRSLGGVFSGRRRDEAGAQRDLKMNRCCSELRLHGRYFLFIYFFIIGIYVNIFFV